MLVKMKPYRRVSSAEASEETKAKVTRNIRDSTTDTQTSVKYQTLQISQQKPLPLTTSAEHRPLLSSTANRRAIDSLHCTSQRGGIHFEDVVYLYKFLGFPHHCWIWTALDLDSPIFRPLYQITLTLILYINSRSASVRPSVTRRFRVLIRRRNRPGQSDSENGIRPGQSDSVCASV